VSVSMLTEGWDTNTVVPSARSSCASRWSAGACAANPTTNPETGLFDVEYADIMRIPFDFAASPQDAKPTKPVTRVHTIKEREAPEIVFPRVSGYRRDLPSKKLEAVFTQESRLVITLPISAPPRRLLGRDGE
jgi:type III restriction enzyme